MKFVTLNLLAAALLLSSISSANAFRVDGHWTPSVWRLQYEGESETSYRLLPGDSVSLEVTFDTEGALSASNTLVALGVGLAFDSVAFEYNASASHTPTYLLYDAAKAPYLTPASTCLPTCDLFFLPPHHVQLDFLSSQVSRSVGVSNNSDPGGESLGTYVFDVIVPIYYHTGPGCGPCGLGGEGFEFLFSEAIGGIVLMGNLDELPLTLGIITPEPTTAVLLGSGLLATAVARRRSGGTRT